MDPENSKTTILVVDDNPTNLRVLFDSLKESGFKTLVATSGERAISQVERTRPDLILLDVMMPGIDGFETSRRLKKIPEIKEIPIIFITALSETEEKVRGFKAGGVDFITKPFQHEEVIARINTHLTIRRLQKQLQQKNELLQSQNELLNQRNDELQELNASRSEFFRIIAHHIRKPSSLLLGYAELADQLAEQQSSGDLVEMVRRVRTSAQKLHTLFENLYTWAKLHHGKMEINRMPLPIHERVAASLNSSHNLLESRQLQISNTIDPEVIALADQNMIDEVLRNLISNAVKFTPDGGQIHIAAEEKDNLVEISVADTGIGIPEEHQAVLFRIEEEYRATEALDGSKGTGLGLILCKELVNRNDGNLWLESQPKQGTTVYFTLPLSGSEPIE